MKIKRFSGIAAFAALSLLFVGSSRAAVDLATLIATNGSVVSPPLTYSGFGYTATGVGATPASSISVSAAGTSLFLDGFFSASPGAPGPLDSKISFTASSTAGISAVSLSALFGVTGNGFASITEDIFTAPGGTMIGHAVITSGGPSTATAFLNGIYSSVYIVKDIGYTALAGGTASISGISQSFTVVPEPASVVMMGLGVVGALGAVRLRRKPALV